MADETVDVEVVEVVEEVKVEVVVAMEVVVVEVAVIVIVGVAVAAEWGAIKEVIVIAAAGVEVGVAEGK